MRNRYLLLLDPPLLAVCVFVAFALRFDLVFVLNPTLRNLFVWTAAAAILLKIPIFLAFGLYGRYWRYAGLGDMLAVGLSVSASTLALALFCVAASLLDLVGGFSRSVLLIDCLLTLVTIGGLRLSIRVVSEARRPSGPRYQQARRVLVLGAGQAGTMVVREIGRNPQLGMQAVGFLDDDPVKKGKRIIGLPVFGGTESLHDVVAERRIDEVIVAMPSAPGTALRRMTDACREAGVSSRTMPGVFELLDGIVSVSRLRQIDITDLLRRAPVSLDSISHPYLTGRTVLVTGAGGSIGVELCRQIARANPRSLILLGHGENSIFDAQVELRRAFPSVPLRAVIADIRDEQRINGVFREHHPAVVFHAAAHKHVPLMEDNAEDAITNNVLGTATIVRAALAHDTGRFVLISTDKAVAPTSVMGASKRLAETIVADAARRSRRAFVSVRFGNVLGSRGSVVPHFKRQIELGGPVTITHPEMRRFFMTIPEAVHLVLQAGGMGTGDDLFVLDMGEAVRVLDLAHDVIKLSGFEVDEIPIVFTGVRPGEKLTEALWEAGARVEATAHPEILRVDEPTPVIAVDRLLADLAQALLQRNRVAIDAALMQWVESFGPSPNSMTTRETDSLAKP
jgi:FlaA1/EpsC-like NDP-sugar epimerase